MEDSSGRDQHNLDHMVQDMSKNCPIVDMFVLCFEKGKFDTGIQEMMSVYQRLINDQKSYWSRMVAVITKVSYVSTDYDNINEWVEEMETWKKNLK